MLAIQYPDLTECVSVRDTDNLLKTEFAFYLMSPMSNSKESRRVLQENGFTDVSCMNNWWPTHCGEHRLLTLWWKKEKEPAKIPPKASRVKWNYSSVPHPLLVTVEAHLAASGCGLKIGEPPFKVSLFHRFFTLMRMPVEVTPIQKCWLINHNYRHLDTGTLASYWVNGWPPVQYNKEKEYEYFNITPEKWSEKRLEW